MSPTTTTGNSAAVARPMLAMSSARRLISVGDPAPSQTTTSKRARRSARRASTCSSSAAFIGRYDSAVTSATGLPRTTTWLEFSPPGLSSTGFIAASGSTRAAAACITWARPISAPSAVTIELLLMFCALKGATETPWRTSHRQIPAVTTDLPASDVVPATKNAPLTSPPRRRSSGSFAELLYPWVSWRARSRCLAPPGLLLTGQVGDGMHDPVGHDAAGAAVAGHPLLFGEGERLAEGHRDAVQPRPARADRLYLVRPRHRDRHHRAVGGEGQPGDARLAPGQPPVPGPRALGVDAEPLAVLQHRERGVERRLRGAMGLPLDRQRPEGAEQRAAEPARDPLPGEVLGLRQVVHLARGHGRDRDAVDERQVIAGQDHRSGQRHVLPPGDVRTEEQPEQRPDDEPGQDVEHAALLPSGRRCPAGSGSSPDTRRAHSPEPARDGPRAVLGARDGPRAARSSGTAARRRRMPPE